MSHKLLKKQKKLSQSQHKNLKIIPIKYQNLNPNKQNNKILKYLGNLIKSHVKKQQQPQRNNTNSRKRKEIILFDKTYEGSGESDSKVE